MPAWAAGDDWQHPKTAVAGQQAGDQVVVAWGGTLSYAGMDAVTAFALLLPGPLPDLRLRRRVVPDPGMPADDDHDQEIADFGRRFVCDIPAGSAHRLLTPPAKAAISRRFPRGQILTVHGNRLMIEQNGWAPPGKIRPAVDGLAAIAGALTAAGVAGTT